MEHEYKKICSWGLPDVMSAMICAVQDSSEFEIGELSHVVLKDTEIKVGYFGYESFELVDPQDESLRPP